MEAEINQLIESNFKNSELISLFAFLIKTPKVISTTIEIAVIIIAYEKIISLPQSKILSIAFIKA